MAEKAAGCWIQTAENSLQIKETSSYPAHFAIVISAASIYLPGCPPSDIRPVIPVSQINRDLTTYAAFLVI